MSDNGEGPERLDRAGRDNYFCDVFDMPDTISFSTKAGSSVEEHSKSADSSFLGGGLAKQKKKKCISLSIEPTLSHSARARNEPHGEMSVGLCGELHVSPRNLSSVTMDRFVRDNKVRRTLIQYRAVHVEMVMSMS